MDTAHRRMEIISILSVKGHITSRELAWELGVTIRTIHHDIFALTFDYPIYTKQGCNGGVFITDNYKPYTNTLTETELETLCRLYGKAEGKRRKSCSGLSINTGRTSWKFNRADGHILFAVRGENRKAY